MVRKCLINAQLKCGGNEKPWLLDFLTETQKLPSVDTHADPWGKKDYN